MASRISQMRNGTAQTPQGLSQAQIDYTKMLMQQFQSMSNPEAAIMSLLQNNPQLQQITPLIRNGNTLEDIARSIAQSKGFDIAQVIKQVGGI